MTTESIKQTPRNFIQIAAASVAIAVSHVAFAAPSGGSKHETAENLRAALAELFEQENGFAGETAGLVTLTGCHPTERSGESP